MEQLTEYLTNTLGEGVIINAVPASQLDKLPVYLRGIYRFGQLKLMDQKFLLVAPQKKPLPPLKQMLTHLSNLEKMLGVITALELDEITAPLRKRLITKRVNFVVPGNQLYFPDLKMDLREQYRVPKAIKENLLPSAQVILLYWILRRTGRIENFTLKKLAQELHYTPMAMTYAVADLQRMELCIVEGTRNKNIRFAHRRRELWDRALPYMVNPVYDAIEADQIPHQLKLYRANISALADYTDISEGNDRYFATNRRTYIHEKRNHHVEPTDDSDQVIHIELWKYDPSLLIDPKQAKASVDPLSLYLSLRSNSDERILKAVNQLLGDIQW